MVQYWLNIYSGFFIVAIIIIYHKVLIFRGYNRGSYEGILRYDHVQSFLNTLFLFTFLLNFVFNASYSSIYFLSYDSFMV
jgi:hypothetical protein